MPGAHHSNRCVVPSAPSGSTTFSNTCARETFAAPPIRRNTSAIASSHRSARRNICAPNPAASRIASRRPIASSWLTATEASVNAAIRCRSPPRSDSAITSRATPSLPSFAT